MTDTSGVVVTGVGAHCALGDVLDTRRALLRGERAVCDTGHDALPGVRFAAAAVPDMSPNEFLRDRKIAKYMSPAARFAVIAAGRALRAAGLAEDAERRSALSLHVATGLIAFDLASVSEAVTRCRGEDGALDMTRLGSDGLRTCPPLMPFKMLLNMSLGLVSIAFGIRGANSVTYPGADQSCASLDTAIRAIRHGRSDAALVGGAAQNLSLMPLATLAREGRLAADAAAAIPYHSAHAGLAPSDGAAFLVIESRKSAAQRGHAALAKLGDVSWSRPAAMGRDTGLAALTDAWNEAAGPHVPRRIITCGTVTPQDDALARQAARVCWPAATPACESFDGAVGWLGAGAPALALALAAWDAAEHPGLGPQLVSATDSAGVCTAVLVSAEPPAHVPESRQAVS